MTTEKALEILTKWKNNYDAIIGGKTDSRLVEDRDALAVAIEMLERSKEK